MSKRKHMNKNPFCKECRIPMDKKGSVKEGEPRFFCSRCGAERYDYHQLKEKEEEDGETIQGK